MANTKIKVQRQCIMCSKLVNIEMTKESQEMLLEGVHIQDAAPYLSVGDREILISGVCSECFDNLCKEDQEEDE